MKTHLETHLTSPQHLEAQQIEPQQPPAAQPRERHKCLTCSDVFATAQELASHSRTHVPPADEVLTAFLTTTTTTTTTKLKLSIAKVTSVKCDQCESSFSSKTALTRHQSVHQERPFRCGHATCSESYRTVKIYSITAQSRQDNTFYIDKGGPFLQLLILDQTSSKLRNLN